MTKPILLAMNNPYSDDPHFALWPDPPRCTGWRTWKMLEEVGGMSQEEYIRAFDRRNLLVGKWDRYRAVRAADDFMRDLPLRSRVIVLGKEPWDVLRIGPAPQPGQEVQANRSYFHYIPHPSGRNLFYNEPVNRVRIGGILRDILARSG